MDTLRHALITSLAAMALILAGCGGDSSVSTKELEKDTSDASPVFKPSAGELPFPSDLTRNDTADGSVNIPVRLDTDGDGEPDTLASNVDSATAPAPAELADPQVALNTMDGFGTTPSISVSFSNPIDPQTLRGNIRVFKPADSCGGSPDPCNLQIGDDPDFPLGTNLGVDLASKTLIAVGEELEFGKDFFINNAGDSGALILPMQPLDPGETYLVVVTDGVKSSTGKAISPSDEYQLAKSGSSLSDPTLEKIRQRVNQHESAVADFTSNTSSSPELAKEDIALSFGFTVENVGGALQSAKAQVDGASGAPAPTFDVHNEQDEWPGGDLDGDGDAGDYAVVSPGADGEINDQGDHAAHIYLGTLNDVRQYVDPGDPNDSLWKGLAGMWADASLPQLNNGDELEAVCSGGFGPDVDSENLVPCNGFTPQAQNPTHSIPVLISAPRTEILNGSFDVPNDGSSETYDCSALQGGPGLPVVIYQHGITTSRATELAIADALAKACVVGVGIDLPKHGILPTDDPFEASQIARLYQALQADDGITNPTSERLVTVSSKDECQDPDNATGVDPSNPDSAPFYCPSGDRYINLENLANARDTYRQGIVDLFSVLRGLKESAPSSDHVGANIDSSSVHFAGVSLGAITGVPFVEKASGDIETATFNVGAGGIAKVLDGSPQFEPRITAGLAEQGVSKPSGSYEGFMIIAQTLFDNADPMNFADSLAGTGTPVLYQEVVGETQLVGSDCSSASCPDQVVPNNVFGQTALTEAWNASTFSNQISFLPGQAGTTQPNALAGTDPLTQGTAFLAQSQQGVLDPVPDTTSPELFYGLTLQQVDPSGGTGSGLVRFSEGSHGSMLDPSSSLAVTRVMQTQLATFIGSYVQTGGTQISGDPNEGTEDQVIQD